MDSLANLAVKTIPAAINVGNGDYKDEGTGLFYCGKCNTPKQMQSDALKFKNVPDSWMFARFFREGIVPIMCRCASEAYEREKQRQEAMDFNQRIQRLRRDGLTDPEYLSWTFDIDDQKDKAISAGCRKYVAEWSKMRADNVGLLFMGDVGTGKTFYACCIANALLDKGITALVTNFPRLLRIIQATVFNDDNMDILNRLQQYELVVIDDLGVERGTSFAMEQVYSVIDTRYRAGKPLIITTNLSPEDFLKPENLTHKRIYDRLLENSPIVVKMVGKSRRKAIGKEKMQKYQDFLGFK